MTKVKFLSAVTRIRWGTDEYGPYDKNQVDDLPPELVQKLMPKGLIAEVIEEPKGVKQTLATFLPEEPEAKVTLPPKAEPPEPKPTPKVMAYDKILSLMGSHLAEFYGKLGTGKSRLVHSIAVEAQNAGKRVLFIDTEASLSEKHVRQLDNYRYIGDELDDLTSEVRLAKEQRNKFDLLVVDSVGHSVYVNYVEMEKMSEKLRSYQELATVFRNMVRFARGERGKDMGKRSALSIVVDHTVSEFSKIAKDLPPEDPLDPFGGQIHRVPKLILRSEPVEFLKDRSIFSLLTFKARDLPKNIEIARFTIDSNGVLIDWKA